MTLATLATAAVLQAIAFTSVAQGPSSQIDARHEVVLRSADEFQALWKTVSRAPLPKVDFTKSIVVGVFLGSRPTPGYRVTVTAVRREGRGAVVEWTEMKPDPSRMVAQVITSPYHLVAIPRDVDNVTFRGK